jgi:hypothetical protein
VNVEVIMTTIRARSRHRNKSGIGEAVGITVAGYEVSIERMSCWEMIQTADAVLEAPPFLATR